MKTASYYPAQELEYQQFVFLIPLLFKDCLITYICLSVLFSIVLKKKFKGCFTVCSLLILFPSILFY